MMTNDQEFHSKIALYHRLSSFGCQYTYNRVTDVNDIFDDLNIYIKAEKKAVSVC